MATDRLLIMQRRITKPYELAMRRIAGLTPNPPTPLLLCLRALKKSVVAIYGFVMPRDCLSIGCVIATDRGSRGDSGAHVTRSMRRGPVATMRTIGFFAPPVCSASLQRIDGGICNGR